MKYVVVTGAYGGMGRKVVERLVGKGFFVFALDRVVGEKEQSILPIEVDLTDEQSVLRAFETVKGITDNVYAVLNFAGVYVLDSLVEISESEFVKTFNVNVFSVYRINKIFLPLLKRGSRVLITTSELAPLDPLPFTGLYAVTKATLSKYAYALDMELQLLGIKVIELRPGAVKTAMLNVSTTALDRFCDNTEHYKCNSKRFKDIVNRVEARNVSPDKIAIKTAKILLKKRPKKVYSINRNPLLLLLNILPKNWQKKIIGRILKEKKTRKS